MGWRGRGGGRSGLWPGNGPFSNLPPWQRSGWLYGRGLGYGAGYGYRGAPYNPNVCRRFPWLPRRWWAARAPEAELEMLEAYLDRLGSEQEGLRKEVEARIDELRRLIKKGSSAAATPPMGPPPFGCPTPSPPTKGQEREMLRQQAEALERQLDAIRRRLEELKE